MFRKVNSLFKKVERFFENDNIFMPALGILSIPLFLAIAFAIMKALSKFLIKINPLLNLFIILIILYIFLKPAIKLTVFYLKKPTLNHDEFKKLEGKEFKLKQELKNLQKNYTKNEKQYSQKFDKFQKVIGKIHKNTITSKDPLEFSLISVFIIITSYECLESWKNFSSTVKETEKLLKEYFKKKFQGKKVKLIW